MLKVVLSRSNSKSTPISKFQNMRWNCGGRLRSGILVSTCLCNCRSQKLLMALQNRPYYRP
jgi:hypothetical protein